MYSWNSRTRTNHETAASGPTYTGITNPTFRRAIGDHFFNSFSHYFFKNKNKNFQILFDNISKISKCTDGTCYKNSHLWQPWISHLNLRKKLNFERSITGDKSLILYDIVIYKQSWSSFYKCPILVAKTWLYPEEVLLCIRAVWKGVIYYKLLTKSNQQLELLKEAISMKRSQLVKRKSAVSHLHNGREYICKKQTSYIRLRHSTFP